MNISFRKDDPVNSLVFETASGRPLYEIETPTGFFSGGMTTIRRMDSPDSSTITSQIDWHDFGTNKVNMNPTNGSDWSKVSSLLTKVGVFTE